MTYACIVFFSRSYGRILSHNRNLYVRPCQWCFAICFQYMCVSKRKWWFQYPVYASNLIRMFPMCVSNIHFLFPNANDVSKRLCFQCMFPIYTEPSYNFLQAKFRLYLGAFTIIIHAETAISINELISNDLNVDAWMHNITLCIGINLSCTTRSW